MMLHSLEPLKIFRPFHTKTFFINLKDSSENTNFPSNKSPEKPIEEGCMQFNKSAFWKSRNIIRYQQKVYTSKTLLQLVKSEIIMLIESTPRKPIDTRIFVNELNEVVEFIK
jgi:hypothetical protein